MRGAATPVPARTVALPGDLLDLNQRVVLTIPEAGSVLGLSKSSAYEAARLGAIPSIRLSARRAVVPVAALRAMLGLPSVKEPADEDADEA